MHGVLLTIHAGDNYIPDEQKDSALMMAAGYLPAACLVMADDYLSAACPAKADG